MYPRTALLLGLLVAAGCPKASKEAPPGAQRTYEAEAAAVAGSRFAGELAGHHFTIALEGGRVAQSGPDGWRWKLGTGEVTVEELGAADADSHFLVERSPRTIVRGEQGVASVVTEVVLVAGGRVFRCTHEQRVDDPDAPAAKAAVERGLAACTSFRVEP